jgi:hypothetical protein
MLEDGPILTTCVMQQVVCHLGYSGRGANAFGEAARDPNATPADITGLASSAPPKLSAVAIVDQRKDAAADRDARLALVVGLLPGSAVFADLRRLLHMEGLARFVVL